MLRHSVIVLTIGFCLLNAGSLFAQDASQPQASLQANAQKLVMQMAQMEKDPNMDEEFQHILYWMGGQQRCSVRRGGRRTSVLGMMVILEKAYAQFKPVVPNLESLLMLASLPRDPYSRGVGGVDSDVNASQILFNCRKQAPMPIMEWVMPELKRFRARRR